MSKRICLTICIMVSATFPVDAIAVGDWCTGDLVATGTPFGQYQIQRLYGDPLPEWVQAAALAAAVVPEQQTYAYNLAKSRLVNAGVGGSSPSVATKFTN
jgi:hypothetical protein